MTVSKTFKPGQHIVHLKTLNFQFYIITEIIFILIGVSLRSVSEGLYHEKLPSGHSMASYGVGNKPIHE